MQSNVKVMQIRKVNKEGFLPSTPMFLVALPLARNRAHVTELGLGEERDCLHSTVYSVILSSFLFSSRIQKLISWTVALL